MLASTSIATLLALPIGLTSLSQDTTATAAPRVAPKGMVWVPAGEFTMGWDESEARPDEGPSHRVAVDAFWIDKTEVTNKQFRAFVEATGYQTTAEIAPKWEDLAAQLPPGTPEPPPGTLVPGSLVFVPTPGAVDLRDFTQWWAWTPGADWRHPFGPRSSIDGKDDYPVVHISWFDAVAYAEWAGKRLPTEAQWERAARFDADRKPLIWGDELEPEGQHMANVWQGKFPYKNDEADGFPRSSPVATYPPNALGLYDMAGNVWEWTSDQFDPELYTKRVREIGDEGVAMNPKGPATASDPRNPYATDSYVQKGGSFLCHADYCSSYRPSAKMATPPDSGMNHLGFRCVTTPKQLEALEAKKKAEAAAKGDGDR